MVAGREVSPDDVKATDRLREYWVHGEGSIKIAWGTPNDYDRCISLVGAHVSPGIVHGLCANYHHDALGIWPATHAKLIRDGEHLPKAKH